MDWDELQRLFDLSAGLPPSERPAFLERECASAELRQELGELLAQEVSRTGDALFVPEGAN